MSSRAERIAAQAMAYGAWQDEKELAQVIALVASVVPRVIVEIGCDAGGTLYAWRQVCGPVYGITAADNSAGNGGRGGRLETHGAVVHVGDSHNPASLHWLQDQLGWLHLPEGRRELELVDVLVIDGDHHEAGVRQDLAMYGPLVRPGGLILLHDIHTTGEEHVEVEKVWPGLAAAYDTGEITAGGPGWGVIRVRAGDTFR